MVKGSGRNALEVERIVADYERSGLSRRLYSERHGIALPTLDWYRRRVQTSRDLTSLVPVRIGKPATSAEVIGSARNGFTLDLGNGRRIEANWNFTDDAMQRLIRIAGAA